MILQDIANKALEVRTAQKNYFKTRGNDMLQASKKAERELDTLLAQWQSGRPVWEQGSLL